MCAYIHAPWHIMTFDICITAFCCTSPTPAPDTFIPLDACLPTKPKEPLPHSLIPPLPQSVALRLSLLDSPLTTGSLHSSSPVKTHYVPRPHQPSLLHLSL